MTAILEQLQGLVAAAEIPAGTLGVALILGLFGGTDLSGFVLNLGGVELRYGAFITSIINFLIMAFVLFCLLKAVNKLTALGKKPGAPTEPTTKVCPFCCSEIPIKAVKCAHCGSDQPKG